MEIFSKSNKRMAFYKAVGQGEVSKINQRRAYRVMILVPSPIQSNFVKKGNNS